MKFIPLQLTGVYKTETFLSRIYLCVNSDDVIQLFLLRNSLLLFFFETTADARAPALHDARRRGTPDDDDANASFRFSLTRAMDGSFSHEHQSRRYPDDAPTVDRSPRGRRRPDASDLFRRAGGPAREMRSIVIPRRSRTTRATRFDAVKRDETMRENVMFFFPSRPGGFERETRRDGDAGGAGEITIGRRRCRDLISRTSRGKKRVDGIFFF